MFLLYNTSSVKKGSFVITFREAATDRWTRKERKLDFTMNHRKDNSEINLLLIFQLFGVHPRFTFIFLSLSLVNVYYNLWENEIVFVTKFFRNLYTFDSKYIFHRS